MTKLRLLALLAVVALVLFPAIAFAQGGLEPPCAFHGTVQVNGLDVDDGTVITAKIGNSSSTTTTLDSTYRIVIAQPEGVSYSGETVSFMIGNATASQTGTWAIGGNVQVNLTKGVAPPDGGGGTVTGATAHPLPYGSEPTADYDPETGIIDFGIPAGAPGTPGEDGAPGEQGPAGSSASSTLGIVAIVLAFIAIALAVYMMVRARQQAAPPPPKPPTPKP